jgi:hypothetical protein
MSDTTFDPRQHYSENPEAARVRAGRVEPTAEQWAEMDRLIALGASWPKSRTWRPTPRSLERWQCDVCDVYSLRSGSYHAGLGWVCDKQTCLKVRWDKCMCMQCQYPDEFRIRRNAADAKAYEEKQNRAK